MGFFKNAEESQASVILTTSQLQPVSYFLEAPGVGDYHNGTLTANNVVIVHLNNSVIASSHVEQDKGIYLTTDSDIVTVIGQIISESGSSSDTFLALPLTHFCTVEYVYFGVSINRTTVVITGAPVLTSIVLVVGTENSTTMKVTVPQSVNVSVGNITNKLTPGREYSFIINRLQTVLIESVEDLTGTKIIADNQVSVFSGHQGANIPPSAQKVDHLIEQIPPTEFWGKVYYTAPLATRKSYTIRVLAAYNVTNVTIHCNDTTECHVINEGEFIHKALILQEYCTIYSNKKVLVMQYSHGVADDPVNGDPMMTLVPATIQYMSQLKFSTIQHSLHAYSHYINIIVIAQHFQPSMIHLRTSGFNRSLESQNWTPIVVNSITEAYATKVLNVPEGTVQLIHANKSAMMTAVAYGFSRSIASYGHPGGLELNGTAGIAYIR